MAYIKQVLELTQGFDKPCATLDMYEYANDPEANTDTVLELRLEAGYNMSERDTDVGIDDNWNGAYKGKRNS